MAVHGIPAVRQYGSIYKQYIEPNAAADRGFLMNEVSTESRGSHTSRVTDREQVSSPRSISSSSSFRCSMDCLVWWTRARAARCRILAWALGTASQPQHAQAPDKQSARHGTTCHLAYRCLALCHFWQHALNGMLQDVLVSSSEDGACGELRRRLCISSGGQSDRGPQRAICLMTGICAIKLVAELKWPV